VIINVQIFNKNLHQLSFSHWLISEEKDVCRATVERVLNKGQRNEKVVKAIWLMAKTNKEVYDFEPIT